MNANVELELEAWRVAWQAQSDGPSASELRDRVARETRRRRVGLVLPVMVTVIIGGWVMSRAIGSGAFNDVVLAFEAWLFIGVVWAGSLWIDRGNQRPLADTTAAFVALSIRRRQSTLAGLRFGAVLYLLQLAFLVMWNLLSASAPAFDVLTEVPVIVLGWIGAPAFVTFARWYGRRVAREIRGLRRLRESLLKSE
jgi:hypothetical protein